MSSNLPRKVNYSNQDIEEQLDLLFSMLPETVNAIIVDKIRFVQISSPLFHLIESDSWLIEYSTTKALRIIPTRNVRNFSVTFPNLKFTPNQKVTKSEMVEAYKAFQDMYYKEYDISLRRVDQYKNWLKFLQPPENVPLLVLWSLCGKMLNSISEYNESSKTALSVEDRKRHYNMAMMFFDCNHVLRTELLRRSMLQLSYEPK